MKYRHPGAINEHLVFNPNFPPSSSSIYKTSLQLKTWLKMLPDSTLTF
jgi:hypothetical protein